MTVTLEIPEELARRLGPEATRMSREALALEALRQGLWTEAELAKIPRIDAFGSRSIP
jgi:predicted transcriptional regulator